MELVVGSKRTSGIIFASAIIYSLWLVFYAVCYYFDLFILPKNSAEFGFMTAALVATIIVSVRIEDLNYSPFILIIVFAVSGRLVGFVGNYISMMMTGKALFLLPFGGLDFFLFNLLLLGLFRFAGLLGKPSGKKGFRAVILIPILLFAAPVLLNLIPGGLNAETVYSFIFTAFAVWTTVSAVSFGLKYPGKKRFAIASCAAVIIDMLIYLQFTPAAGILPPKLNYLLLPFALFYLIEAAVGITKDDIND